jgi:hypothetical protein
MREVRKARAKQAGVELTVQAATISEITRKGVVLGGTHLVGSKCVLRTGDESLRTEALVCLNAEWLSNVVGFVFSSIWERASASSARRLRSCSALSSASF